MSDDLDLELLEETQRAVSTIRLPPRERWQPPRRRVTRRRFGLVGGAVLLTILAVGAGRLLAQWRADMTGDAGSAQPTGSPTNSPSAEASRTTSVPAGAWSVALDELRGQAYVGGPSALTVIDARTINVVGTLSLPSRQSGPKPGGAVAVDERTGRVYVTDFVEDKLYVVDGVLMRVLAAIQVGRAPTAVVVDASSDRVYVANLGHQAARTEEQQPGSISIVEGASMRVLATIDLGGFPTALAMHSRTKTLYVAQLGRGQSKPSLAMIDALSGRLKATVPIGPPLGIAVSDLLDVVYVLEDGSADQSAAPTRLLQLDLNGRFLRQLAQFPKTTALAVRANAGRPARFYVAERFPDGGGRLGVYEHLGGADSFFRVAIPGLPSEASGIALDSSGGWIYVASRPASSVTRVADPPSR